MTNLDKSNRENVPNTPTKASFRQKARQLTEIELLAQGVTQDEICKRLKISRKTLLRDRRDIGASPLIDALLLKQLEELGAETDRAIRLRERRELIRILSPHRVESKVDAEVHTHTIQVIRPTSESEAEIRCQVSAGHSGEVV